MPIKQDLLRQWKERAGCPLPLVLFGGLVVAADAEQLIEDEGGQR